MVADARLRDGQAQAAVDILKPAYEKDPANEELSRRLAMAYMLVQNYAAAIPILDATIARRPTDQEALVASRGRALRAGARRAPGCPPPTRPSCGSTSWPTRAPTARCSRSISRRCKRGDRRLLLARVQLPVVLRRHHRVLRPRLRRQRLGLASGRVHAARRGRARLRRDGAARLHRHALVPVLRRPRAASSTTIAGCPRGSTRRLFDDLDAALEIALATGVRVAFVMLDHRWMYEGLTGAVVDPVTGDSLQVTLAGGPRRRAAPGRGPRRAVRPRAGADRAPLRPGGRTRGSVGGRRRLRAHERARLRDRRMGGRPAAGTCRGRCRSRSWRS